jgi:Copper type II ascorbate-dependent monooxygenase, C-terminal domain
MSNSHVRNGEVIRRAEAQFWDFDQQGSLTVVQQPFTIAPGDSFRTSCIYNTQNDEQFGLASSQEMCIAFLFYYPRQAFNFGDLELPYLCGMRFGDFYPACNVDWSNSSLSDMSHVGRSFGVAPSTCPAPPVAISSTSPTASPTFSGAVLEPSDSSTVSPTAAPVSPDSKTTTPASPTSSGTELKPLASSTVTLATTICVGLMVIHAALVAYL